MRKTYFQQGTGRLIWVNGRIVFEMKFQRLGECYSTKAIDSTEPMHTLPPKPQS